VVEQRADDRALSRSGQRSDLAADGLQVIGCQSGQALAQQVPLGGRQLRHLGEPLAAAIATLAAQPVGVVFADARHPGVDIDVQFGQLAHCFLFDRPGGFSSFG
jgi:hypothetical protein